MCFLYRIICINNSDIYKTLSDWTMEKPIVNLTSHYVHFHYVNTFIFALNGFSFNIHPTFIRIDLAFKTSWTCALCGWIDDQLWSSYINFDVHRSIGDSTLCIRRGGWQRSWLYLCYENDFSFHDYILGQTKTIPPKQCWLLSQIFVNSSFILNVI